MKPVFVFPGQGSQYVGMGKELAENFEEARHVFEEVDDALGQHLSKLMFEGPEADLNLTENTQPALMAMSLAIIQVLNKQGSLDVKNDLSFVAGHSLGEYSALATISALEVAQTAKLLKIRGQAMQEAVPVGKGSMAAVLGLDFDAVKEIASSVSNSEICQAANDNSPGQVVVSGHVAAVDRAVALAAERGARRSVVLPVSAPFHCQLMAPAAQKMSQALAGTNIRPPMVPVVSNVTAKAEDDPNAIRRLLVDQITETVRWRESIEWMVAQGVTQFYEIGAGKVLSGLIKKINRDVSCEPVGTTEQIEQFLTSFKG